MHSSSSEHGQNIGDEATCQEGGDSAATQGKRDVAGSTKDGVEWTERLWVSWDETLLALGNSNRKTDILGCCNVNKGILCGAHLQQ